MSKSTISTLDLSAYIRRSDDFAKALDRVKKTVDKVAAVAV